MEQHIACRRLLSAVLALAVKDACRKTTDLRTGFAREALDFLFLHADGYLSALDINAYQFRQRLLDYCYSDRKDPDNAFELNDYERYQFRANYKRWYEITTDLELAA